VSNTEIHTSFRSPFNRISEVFQDCMGDKPRQACISQSEDFCFILQQLNHTKLHFPNHPGEFYQKSKKQDQNWFFKSFLTIQPW